MDDNKIRMGLTSGLQKYTDAIESVRPPVFLKTRGDEGEILIGKIKLAYGLSQIGNFDQLELPECAFLIETDGIICQAVDLGRTIHAIDPLWSFDDTDLIFEPIESHTITVRGEPCLIRYLPVQDSAESHWRKAIIEDYATLEPKQKNLTAAVNAILRINEQFDGSMDTLSPYLAQFGPLESSSLFEDKEIVRLLCSDSTNPNDEDFFDSVFLAAIKRGTEHGDIEGIDKDHSEPDESEEIDPILEEIIRRSLDEVKDKLLAALNEANLSEANSEEELEQKINAAMNKFDADDDDDEVDENDSDEPDFSQYSALTAAAFHNDPDAILALCRSGTDINEVDPTGDTALLMAVKERHEGLVRLLVKHGANIKQPDNYGVLPILLAVLVDDEGIVKTLLDAGADVNSASTFPHDEIAVGGCTPLWGAVVTGNLRMCRLLLKHGADLDAMNDICATPLSVAINRGHDEIIDFLLKQGAKADFEIPPAKAILLENSDELGGVTPLYIAAGNQDIGTIKKLLKRGANVNRTGRNGFTPLKRAAYMGCLDVVKILLKTGSDPNIADHDNFTPLMNATTQEHADIVKLLLKNGADPNVQSKWRKSSFFATSGKTALMDAAADGNIDIARLLLAHKADPNLMNEDGETALHAAVKGEHTDMVNLLLRSGGDADVYGPVTGSATELALRTLVEKDEDEREGNIVDILKLLFKQGVPKGRETVADIVDRVAEDTDENIQQLLSVHGIKLPRT